MSHTILIYPVLYICAVGSSCTVDSMEGWERISRNTRVLDDSDQASLPVSVSMSAYCENDMQTLVQKAVDEALDKAQRQW